MEKAILKTLLYANIFDYPLKGYEIHKWLIGRKANLTQVERALKKLVQRSKIKDQSEYYFLPRRKKLVITRKRKEKQSSGYLRKAKVLTLILKIIPWIKLVGISGGLSMDNASRKDDIDLFIIVSINRLWISRFLSIIILDLMGVRRKVNTSKSKVGGKLCLNIFLQEDKLEQKKKDIYTAHEVLQMKVLWQRQGIYSRYLEDNEWAFKFLPNWIANDASLRGLQGRSNLIQRLPRSQGSLAMTMVEYFAKWLQLKIMQKPQGMERIEDGALYFHPEDCREKILKEYSKKVKKIVSP